MDAVYTSVFDDDTTCESKCSFDPATMRVYAIEPAAEEDNDAAEFANALTDEFVTLPDERVLRVADGVTFDY